MQDREYSMPKAFEAPYGVYPLKGKEFTLVINTRVSAKFNHLQEDYLNVDEILQEVKDQGFDVLAYEVLDCFNLDEIHLVVQQDQVNLALSSLVALESGIESIRPDIYNLARYLGQDNIKVINSEGVAYEVGMFI